MPAAGAANGAAGATVERDPPSTNEAGTHAAGTHAAGSSAAAGHGATGSSGSAPPVGGAGRGEDPKPSGPGSVGRHGVLHVEGNRIVDALGEPVQLRGMGLFWSQWSNYYAARTVDQRAIRRTK